MALKDSAIVAFAETKLTHKGGVHAWELAAQVLETILDRTGYEKGDIDGLIVSSATNSANNIFWPQATADELGLELDFCDGMYIGGCNATGAVARAAAALDAGLCRNVLLLFTSTSSTSANFRAGSDDLKWTDPFGLAGPPAAFGLLTRRYEYQHGLDYSVLGKLAVTQRGHALLNTNACEKLRKPITVDDYLNSRMIADPIRLLDCVMRCDGASAFLMTSRRNAAARSLERQVVPIGYGERSNYQVDDPLADVTQSGHAVAGARAFAAAGLSPKDIQSIHLYDDFLIAVVIQLEMLGFCAPGQGIDFVREHDLSHLGDLPLNTGGGQISAGQGASASVNLTEAVRQLFGEGDARQVDRKSNALVTGIGWINYARNWGSSTALVLSAEA